jgi:hypothetical protein
MIEVHAGHITDNAPPFQIFQAECERYLPEVVPSGRSLIVRRHAAVSFEDGERALGVGAPCQ